MEERGAEKPQAAAGMDILNKNNIEMKVALSAFAVILFYLFIYTVISTDKTEG